MVTRRILSRSGVSTFVLLLFASLLPAAPVSAEDPVEAFQLRADSLRAARSDTLLAQLVKEKTILAGAGVAQLLDRAVGSLDAGDREDAARKLDLAEAVSGIYARTEGSSALERLVRVYRGWTPQQRALRQKGKALEARAAEARSARDFEGAAKLLAQANEIYIGIGDSYSEAVVYGSLGVAVWGTGDFRRVLEHYEKALSARRAIENRILEGRTLNGLGTTYFMLEDYASAISFYEQAIALRRKTGDLAGLATSMTYLGNAYAGVGRLIAARDAYDEALALLGSSGTNRQRLELLNGMASLYTDMGRMRRAAELYREALAIAVEDGDRNAEIVCRNNIALSLYGAGNLREAANELARVEALLASAPDPVQTMFLYRNRGLVSMEMGELGDARDDYLRYLSAAKSQGMRGHEGTAFIKLGYLFFELGALDRGLACADSALAVATTLEDGMMARESRMLAAEIEQVRGNAEASLGHWQAALDHDRASAAESRMLEDELGIAIDYAMMNRGEEARSLFAALRPRIRDAGRDDLLVPLNLGMGHIYERTMSDSSRIYYETALGIIEKTRAEVGGAEAGAEFLGGTRRYFYEEIARFYARVARETGSAEWSSEAFRTIERAKARGLLDLLSRSLASEHTEIEEAVLDSMYSIDRASAEGRAQLKRLERRYEEIRSGRVAGATVRIGSEERLGGLSEVQGAIPKNTVVCAYALGDSASFLWVIERDRAELFELPKRAALRPDVEALRDALMRPGLGDAAFVRSARRLFQSLLEPAAPRLWKKKELVIVPDGFLFELPFETLLTEDYVVRGGSIAWTELPFLARRSAIVYEPSVAVYLKINERVRSEGPETELIAVGDPDYAACADSGEVVPAALPFSRGEVSGVGSNFDGTESVILLGREATESGLKRALSTARTRVLHIAAHGFVDAADPVSSNVALCRDVEGREDGRLHTLEILSLPLHAHLVVLSACESARGRIGRGEGVVGLSRAFIGAGAKGVVSSLWAVSDESTSLLMQEFYRRMVGGKKPAFQALNDARITLLEKSPKFSHPFYWSPFIFTGSQRSPK